MHARPQEILADANFFDDGDHRRTFGAEQGLRSCSVRLHTVLGPLGHLSRSVLNNNSRQVGQAFR
jgi:hypothetical protein